MQVDIAMQTATADLWAEVRGNVTRAAENLERSHELMTEAIELNLESKRLLLENAKLLRKAVGGAAAMHIADEGDVEGDRDEREKPAD